MNLRRLYLLFSLMPSILIAQEQCLSDLSIKALDAEFESAINVGSLVRIEKLLHPDFVWVHNHAGSIQETKQGFVEFFAQSFGRYSAVPLGPLQGIRAQHDVKVIRAGNSSVIYGFVEITRPGPIPAGRDSRPIETYHFMRTYVYSDNGCLLLANHTMNIPNE